MRCDLLLVNITVGGCRAFEMSLGKDVSLPTLIYVNMIFVESLCIEIQCHTSFCCKNGLIREDILIFHLHFFFSICAQNPLSLLYPKTH